MRVVTLNLSNVMSFCISNVNTKMEFIGECENNDLNITVKTITCNIKIPFAPEKSCESLDPLPINLK